MVLRLATPAKLSSSWAASSTASSSRQTLRSFTSSSAPAFSFRDIIGRRGALPKEKRADGTTEETPSKPLTQRLRETAVSTLFGGRRELELSRLRKGITPADQRKLDEDSLRARALASVDAEGNPLLLEGEDQDIVSQRAARVAERMQARQRGRLERKRWNGITVPEHKYSTAAFKISPKKLQLLADQVRGRPIDYAILQMQFSPKRAAKRVKATLCLARDHAIAKGMDRKRLVVNEAWVGKDQLMKKAEYKGRMRMGIRKTYFSHMDIVLRHGRTVAEEQRLKVEKARRTARSIATGGVQRTSASVGMAGRSTVGTAWGY